MLLTGAAFLSGGSIQYKEGRKPRLLEWERLRIIREKVNKWNGKMPDVFAGGGGQGLLMNIPTSKSGEGK